MGRKGKRERGILFCYTCSSKMSEEVEVRYRRDWGQRGMYVCVCGGCRRGTCFVKKGGRESEFYLMVLTLESLR